MAKYFAFRILLSQPAQLNAFEQQRTKRQLLELAVQVIERNYPFRFQAKGNLYLAYYHLKINDGTHAIQIAREDIVLEPKVGEHGVTNQPDTVYPYSYFILDISRQIILVQEKPSAFRDIDSIVSRIEDIIRKALIRQRVTVAIEAISNSEDIWSEIEEAQEIYSLVVDIDPPNFFGSRFRSNIDIREAYEETNFTKFKLVILNKLGALRIPREQFENLFQTISSGAGDFIIKLRDRTGHLLKIGSSTRPKSLEMPEEPSKINPTLLEDEIIRIDNLNNTDTLNNNSPTAS
jgi:hypothetical protein